MEMQLEVWHQSKWEILFETISPFNPNEFLYGVRIGTRIHDEDPFITVLISNTVYDLIYRNEVDIIINDSFKEPISIYQHGKKIRLKN